VVTIGSKRYPDGTLMPWPVSDEEVPEGWIYGPTPKAAISLYQDMLAAVHEAQQLLHGKDPA
jgi:hypothetical protein